MRDTDAKSLLARAYALKSEVETRALYRDWAQTYDGAMLDGLGYLTPRRTAQLLATATPDRKGPVLDVGSGTGLAGRALAALGFACIDALDFSPEMLAVAAKTGVYRDFHEADLNRPLPGDLPVYAAMICTGTFTHGHVGAACLPALFDRLAPGGCFACTVHRDVWDTAGFGEMTDRLAGAGVMTTLRREAGKYYKASPGYDGWFVVWRKTGSGEAGVS